MDVGFLTRARIRFEKKKFAKKRFFEKKIKTRSVDLYQKEISGLPQIDMIAPDLIQFTELVDS